MVCLANFPILHNHEWAVRPEDYAQFFGQIEITTKQSYDENRYCFAIGLLFIPTFKGQQYEIFWSEIFEGIKFFQMPNQFPLIPTIPGDIPRFL